MVENKKGFQELAVGFIDSIAENDLDSMTMDYAMFMKDFWKEIGYIL